MIEPTTASVLGTLQKGRLVELGRDELDSFGEKLCQARAKYMALTDQGYNALKDPSCTNERILEPLHLHEEMDRAVLRSYPRLPGVGPKEPSRSWLRRTEHRRLVRHRGPPLLHQNRRRLLRPPNLRRRSHRPPLRPQRRPRQKHGSGLPQKRLIQSKRRPRSARSTRRQAFKKGRPK